MKKINLLILSSLLALGGLSGCDEASEPAIQFTPSNSFEEVMLDLTENNFSVDYYCSYFDTGNVEQNQKFYYTKNAYQNDGYQGFTGIAKDDENVFKYTIEDGEVVSGQPLINYNTGMRYEDVYEYANGLQDFDLTKLSYEELGNNTYKYNVGNDYDNDKAFLAVFLRYNILSSVMPESIEIKVVKDVLMFDCVLMSYYDADGNYLGQNNCRAIVHSVGETKLEEIEQYLADGKTSKKPLDNRIIRLINPYMHSNNYTVYLDATGMNQKFKAYEYFTDYAYYEVPDYEGGSTPGGYVESNGYVHTYTVKDDELEIIGTPYADSDFNFYTSLYGQVFTYTFSSLYYNNFVGYIDEENENSYYITDSQFVYTLSYLCYVEISEELYTDKARIEIVNDETHEFNVYLDLYNKQTKQELGTFKARFYNLNNTVIPAVDRYLNTGKNPNNQSKEELQNVLDLFKEGNYSMDSMTGAGLAKIYQTENYFYEELYQNPNNNFGYIKLDDGIYEFTMFDGEMNINYNTKYNIDMPGCGSYFGGSDDLAYFSHFDDSVCNADNYELAYTAGIHYWKNVTPGFSQKTFNYIFGQTDQAYPMGSGITCSLGENPYDTRVTVYTTYVLASGDYYGKYSFTYYDIGNTSHPTIEQFLQQN